MSSEDLKAGVVKITAHAKSKQPKVGTGIIIRVDAGSAYIMTAAHVIEGDPEPQVQFYSDSAKSFSATVLGQEGGNPRGLAAVVVQAAIPAGLKALHLDATAQLSGGEAAVFIGFPRLLATPWAVTTGSVTGQSGQAFTVQGPIEEGNSGGPVLVNRKVVGLIVEGQGQFGYAIPAAMLEFAMKSWARGSEHGTSTGSLPGPSEPAGKKFSEPLAKETTGQDGPPMVVIPAGEFWMGSPDGVGDEHERPVHEVRFSKPFAIARYETTFEEYDRFAQATGRKLPDDGGLGRGRRPVINVPWEDARDYAAWLSQQTGKRYRLPTEAEWEYAARSGGTHDIWAGTSDENRLEEYAVYGATRPEPVGGKKPNGLGLYDMSGNVEEWVEDCWHDNYKGAPTDRTAWEGASGGNCIVRVTRGGSWLNHPQDVRASFRNTTKADLQGFVQSIIQYGNTGFRLAQDLQ